MATASSFPHSSKLWFQGRNALRTALISLILVAVAHSQATEKIIRTLGSPFPNGGLIFDTKGNLYGTTHGVNRYYGTVFESLHFANGTWGNKLLYSFTGGADGGYPYSPLALDAAGNLYGAATVGGTDSCPYSNLNPTCGVVFELMPTARGFWTERCFTTSKAAPMDRTRRLESSSIAQEIFMGQPPLEEIFTALSLSWCTEATVLGRRRFCTVSQTVLMVGGRLAV
jgi:hypothetical protein